MKSPKKQGQIYIYFDERADTSELSDVHNKSGFKSYLIA
jgi:hypothetical protein